MQNLLQLSTLDSCPSTTVLGEAENCKAVPATRRTIVLCVTTGQLWLALCAVRGAEKLAILRQREVMAVLQCASGSASLDVQ